MIQPFEGEARVNNISEFSLCHTHQEKKNRMVTQIRLYKVMAVSAGLYVSENWLLADKYKNRLQVVEMTFLYQCLE
jgi:hypothetical protein